MPEQKNEDWLSFVHATSKVSRIDAVLNDMLSDP